MRLPLLELASTFLSLASGPFPSSSSSKGVLTSETRAAIESTRRRLAIPGAVVAVVTPHGEEILSLGVGDASGTKVTDESLFAIASNSKLFTAISIGLLINNDTKLPNGNTLGWDTKIADILPKDMWKLPDEYASAHVDIVDLMSMRSGMPSHDFQHVDAPAPETIRMMRNLRHTAEIRQVFQYNNNHYTTLAHIVTTLSGMPFVEYSTTHILEPVGLSRSTYNWTTARERGMTDGFAHLGINMTACREKSPDVHHTHPSCTGRAINTGWHMAGNGMNEAGAGGVVSCGKDMIKWLRELLAPKNLPADILTRVAAPLIPAGQSPFPKYPPIFMHTGGVPGQTSLILRLPNDGLGVAILTNDDNGPDFFMTSAYRIIDDVLGLHKIDWDKRMFEGRYWDEAYGDIDLRTLSNDSLSTVLRDRLVLEGENVSSVFVAEFPKVFTSHLLFTHVNGSTWTWSAAHVHDAGEMVISTYGSGPAVVTPAGIGMFGEFTRASPLFVHEPSEVDVQSRSVVWFGAGEDEEFERGGKAWDSQGFVLQH